MNRTLATVIFVVVGLVIAWAFFTMGPGTGGWVLIGLSLVALLGLAALNARNTFYKCPKCSYIFQIGVFTELFSSYRPAKGKNLRCPRCDRTGWAMPSPKSER